MMRSKVVVTVVLMIIVLGAIYLLLKEHTILPPEIARLNPFDPKNELSSSDIETIETIRKKLPETAEKVEEALKTYGLRIVRGEELNPDYSYKDIFIIKDFDRNGQLDLAVSCFHDREKKAYALIILNGSIVLHPLYEDYGMQFYKLEGEYVDSLWLTRGEDYEGLSWHWKPYWPTDLYSIRPCFGIIYGFSYTLELYWDGEQFIELWAYD